MQKTYTKSFSPFVASKEPRYYVNSMCWRRHHYWQRRTRYASTVSAHTMRTGSTSTVIAELLTAFAGHSRAAIITLNPEFTSRTLLVLGSVDKLYEVFIIFVETVVDLVLCASHAVMVFTFATQAIVLAASRATIIVQFLLETEDSSAASSRTPSS